MQAEPANIKIQTTRAWDEHSSHLNASKQRAHLCSLDIRNRSGKQLLVRKLRLRWHRHKGVRGAPRTLYASLYKKREPNDLRTDEENFLASGIWNANTRTITFTFKTDEELKISSRHYFSIVIDFDAKDINLLRKSTLSYDDALPLVTQHSTK